MLEADNMRGGLGAGGRQYGRRVGCWRQTIWEAGWVLEADNMGGGLGVGGRQCGIAAS